MRTIVPPCVERLDTRPRIQRGQFFLHRRGPHATTKNTSSGVSRCGKRSSLGRKEEAEEEEEETEWRSQVQREELTAAISEVREKYAFEAQSRTRTHSMHSRSSCEAYWNFPRHFLSVLYPRTLAHHPLALFFLCTLPAPPSFFPSFLLVCPGNVPRDRT